MSCITDVVLNVTPGGYEPREEPHGLVLGDGDAVLLPGHSVALKVRINYRIVKASGQRGPWRVNITAYRYVLQTPDVGREIVAYHWDPQGRSHVVAPHLHIGPAALARESVLSRKHLPTGRISLEEVLRFAIMELGVKARRMDWGEILDRNQKSFEDW